MTQSLLPGSHWYCWERGRLCCDDTETIPCKPGASLQGDPQRAPGFLAFRPLVVPTRIFWVLVWITTECCARDGPYLSLVTANAARCGCCPALSRVDRSLWGRPYGAVGGTQLLSHWGLRPRGMWVNLEADPSVLVKSSDDYNLCWHLSCNLMRDPESKLHS